MTAMEGESFHPIARELLDRESFMPVGCVDSPSMAIMTVQSSQFMESLVPRVK